MGAAGVFIRTIFPFRKALWYHENISTLNDFLQAPSSMRDTSGHRKVNLFGPEGRWTLVLSHVERQQTPPRKQTLLSAMLHSLSSGTAPRALGLGWWKFPGWEEMEFPRKQNADSPSRAHLPPELKQAPWPRIWQLVGLLNKQPFPLLCPPIL